MGLFKSIKEAANLLKTDEPIEGALIGRGVITSVQPTGTSVVKGGVEHYFCRVGLEISLDETDRYSAMCTHKMTPWAIAQVQAGSTAVCVEVDPEDLQHVRIDTDRPAPVVRFTQPQSGRAAAEVLATGEPCTVAVLQFTDLGMINPDDLPVYGFSLTVLRNGDKPYQVQVGNPVLPDAIPLLYPGARLPAKVLADSPNSVVIDFQAALAEV